MRKIAFIPARSGSKGVPNKNILMLNGLTLLERAIKTAAESEVFDDIFVSTDSHEYAEIASSAGGTVPYLRPPELARDTTKTIDVLLELLNYLKINDAQTVIFLLQVTTPFRSANHIKESAELLNSSHFTSSLMSIKEVEGMHPYRMQIRNTDNLFANYENFSAQNFDPRQSLPKVYIRNGCIYANSAKDIVHNRRLIRDVNIGFEMNSIDSINIDTIEDYWLAQSIVQNFTRK